LSPSNIVVSLPTVGGAGTSLIIISNMDIIAVKIT
jgi:hypothetical protein